MKASGELDGVGVVLGLGGRSSMCFCLKRNLCLVSFSKCCETEILGNLSRHYDWRPIAPFVAVDVESVSKG